MLTTVFRTMTVLALASCIGCGSSSGFPKTYPVSGSVKLNGKPVEGAIVTFQIEGGKNNAVGNTDAKGEYTLTMFRPGDGAIPGQYRVAITKPDAVAPSAKPAGAPGQIGSGELSPDYAPPAAEVKPAGGSKKGEIPAKYANDQTSALRATVSDSAPNRFDFDLK